MYISYPVWQVPMAKASIYWLVGEYCSLVPKISPDVLRKAAKAFPNEVCVQAPTVVECTCT